MNNDMECLTCIKRKTKWCPNSSECYETIDKPYYQNRIVSLEENQQLKKQLEKENKNWNELKEWLEEYPDEYVFSVGRLVEKMEDLERL